MNAKMLFQKSKNNKTRLPLIIYNEWDHKKLKQLAIYLDKELCIYNFPVQDCKEL